MDSGSGRKHFDLVTDLWEAYVDRPVDGDPGVDLVDLSPKTLWMAAPLSPDGRVGLQGLTRSR